jgi:hypothetical protein
MNTLPPAPTPLEDVFNTPPSKLPRNKSTEAIHQRETLVQIYIPMIAGGLLVLAVCILAIVAGVSGNSAATRVWADVSLVFVILQTLVMLLPVLVLVGGLAAGVWYLVKILPPYMKVAQDYILLFGRKVEQAAQYAVKPVIKTKSAVAGVDNFFQNIRKFFKR